MGSKARAAPKAAPQKAPVSKTRRRCVIFAYLLLLLGVCLSPAGLVWWQFAVHEPSRIHLIQHVVNVFESENILRLVEDPALWDIPEDPEGSQPDLPRKEMRVHEMPALLAASQPTIDRMLGLVRRLYDLSEEPVRLRDLYAVKYDSDGAVGLPAPDDEHTLSFHVALSRQDSYDGGGLRFDLYDQPLAQPLGGEQGTAVLFPSKLQYREVELNRGAKYALVGLISVGDDDTWTLPPLGCVCRGPF